jgi:putative addiction module component (TIGR02574 family)
MKSLGVDRLGVEERLALVEEIWDSIAADSNAVPLTDAQRTELERRYEEDEASPDDVTSWEDVKAATLRSPSGASPRDVPPGA